MTSLLTSQMDKAMKPTGLRKMTSSLRQGYKADGPTKNNKFVKSTNGQGNKADGLTKNDKSIKSINGQGYKAGSLIKNDRFINPINGRGYKVNGENKPVKSITRPTQ